MFLLRTLIKQRIQKFRKDTSKKKQVLRKGRIDIGIDWVIRTGRGDEITRLYRISYFNFFWRDVNTLILFIFGHGRRKVDMEVRRVVWRKTISSVTVGTTNKRWRYSWCTRHRSVTDPTKILCPFVDIHRTQIRLLQGSLRSTFLSIKHKDFCEYYDGLGINTKGCKRFNFGV